MVKSLIILISIVSLTLLAQEPPKFIQGKFEKLSYKKYAPATDSKGVVILTHGVLEHSGRYLPLVNKINQAGFTVYSYDLAGHGDSTGSRAYIEDFITFSKDLSLIIDYVKANEPGADLYLFGHSMGGLIVFSYLQGNNVAKEVNGVVLSAPAFSVPLDAAQELKVTAARIARLVDGTMLSGEDIKVELLTDDIEMQKKHSEDKKNIAQITIGLGVELIDAAELARFNLNELKPMPPIFFIQGESDEIVDGKLNVEIAKILSSKQNTVVVKNGLHEILNAKVQVRDMVMDKIVKFISSENSPMVFDPNYNINLSKVDCYLNINEKICDGVINPYIAEQDDFDY